MTCIRTMQKTSPPILIKAGSAHVRYVAFGHHQTWTVNFVAAMERINSADMNRDSDDAVHDPRNWTVPRMWHTLDGAVDRSVYETCLHAVLTHIADKPGISKVWREGAYMLFLLGVFPWFEGSYVVGHVAKTFFFFFLSYQRYLSIFFFLLGHTAKELLQGVLGGGFGRADR